MKNEYINKIKNFCKWLIPFAAAVFFLFGCQPPAQPSGALSVAESVTATVSESETETDEETAAQNVLSEEDGSYSSKDEVALYLHTYGKLPGNYITKKQAQHEGWVSKDGNLWDVAPGKSIGGDHYGNYEEQLPDKKGRKWRECDIDFDGSYRGAKRIIFSNDGLIYYTEDHYKTFEQLY